MRRIAKRARRHLKALASRHSGRLRDLMHLAHAILEVEADVPSGLLGQSWRRFGLPRGLWGVSAASSPLAALEATPGRAPITQCRLLLTAKPT